MIQKFESLGAIDSVALGTMQLHDQFIVNENVHYNQWNGFSESVQTHIIRVSGGWIYAVDDSSVFVPEHRPS